MFTFLLSLAPLSDKRAQQIIDKALESSSFDMRNIVAVITGLMGSGKTWLLSRLFKKLPPDVYCSTGVADQSVRGLLHHIINMSFNSWESFTHKQILEFLACVFHETLPEIDYTTPLTQSATPYISFSSNTTSATDDPSSLSTAMTTEFSSNIPLSDIPVSSPVRESSTMESMVRMVKAPKRFITKNMLELIHMIDTGGQPELLETMPGLIHHCHLAVLVLNLMFGLDEHPSIDYHEDGRSYKRTLPSLYSNRQIIHKLASTLQVKRFSHTESQFSRLLVVATHKDCVPKEELQTKVRAFDQALRAILLPSTKEQMICFSAKQIPFILNLKTPEKDDMIQLDLIRSKISESEVGEVVKTPGSFLVFEQVLMEFANQTVKREILSFKECLLVGDRLKMKQEEVEAALIFFHNQFSLLYFHHILPNLVFMRPQTPLDCINAVVRFSYKIESGELKGVKSKLVESLRDGIITEEILYHKELTNVFIPGLYEPQDAIELLCHTLSLAPLSRKDDSTTDVSPATSHATPSVKRDKREYLMMCLRPAISDIPQHLPPPSNIAPLVVQFSTNCVPLSCFSRTISCLLAVYNWKLSRADNGSPQCLTHNVVSLCKPQTPGEIVLVDMGHNFQVHLNMISNTKLQSFCNVCFQVQETIFAAIKQVLELLSLAETEVFPAFLCPCSREPIGHAASAYLFHSQWLLHCCVAEKCAGEADIEHKLWLDVPVVEQERPSLPKLLGLKLPQKVGIHYTQFGILLLNDEDGSLVYALEDECNGKPERIVCKTLATWVRGRGRALTWNELADTLRECDLASTADHVLAIYCKQNTTSNI